MVLVLVLVVVVVLVQFPSLLNLLSKEGIREVRCRGLMVDVEGREETKEGEWRKGDLIEFDTILPIGHVVFDDFGAAFGGMLAADAFDEVAVGICLFGLSEFKSYIWEMV